MALPVRKPLRLRDYDYAQGGVYFITICTAGRQCFLGLVPPVGAIHESPAVRLTDCGQAVADAIAELPQRFSLEVSASVVMPNHVHLLLTLNSERAIHESPLRDACGSRSTPAVDVACGSGSAAEADGAHKSGSTVGADGTHKSGSAAGTDGTHGNGSAAGRRSPISQAVGYLKWSAGRQIRVLLPLEAVWQRGYYDHIIRDESDFLRIWRYIDENPARWADDEYYSM